MVYILIILLQTKLCKKNAHKILNYWLNSNHKTLNSLLIQLRNGYSYLKRRTIIESVESQVISYRKTAENIQIISVNQTYQELFLNVLQWNLS